MICWHAFDDGRSLGTPGPENGITLKDEEHEEGARITLEKDGHIAPFTITLGIYGAMFDTRFYGSLVKAEEEFETLKDLMEQALSCWDDKDRKPFYDAIDRLVEYGR